MRIVIASGKGGVGKSTVASSLALLFATRYDIQLIDADVDCPDLPIIFKGKELVREPVYLSKVARIDSSLCDHCMVCYEKCPFGAIDKDLNVDPVACEGCGLCSHLCPRNAITLEPVLTGYVVKTRVNYKFRGKELEFPVVHGELVPGRSSSGRIVDELKKLEEDKDVTIVDSAAGVGCPVIASVQGADYALLVTEPTPSALDDLKRMSDLASHFGIPQMLVINKSTISDTWKSRVLEFASAREIEVLGEIPFHDSAFKAISNGRPLIDYDSPLKGYIENIFHRVLEVVE